MISVLRARSRGAGRAAGTGSRQARLIDGGLVWSAFACVLAAGLAYLLWKGRGNALFYDEWSWIEFRRSGLHAILSSYNQHLLLVPLAAYQLLIRTVGLGHYWVYRLIAALAHLGCAAVVFAFARRRIGAIALLIAIPVVFLGSGWEFVLWGVNFGFTASIALCIAALLALDKQDRSGDAVAAGLLLLALAFSEYAVLFSVGIAAELSWRDRRPTRAWVWAGPLALYAAWWLAYYQPTDAATDIAAMPKFVVNMASSAAGGLFGRDIYDGRAILAVVVLFLGWRMIRCRALSPRLVGLSVTLGLFWLVVAYGRAAIGEPYLSTYIYTGVVMIVLIAAEACRGTEPGAKTTAFAALLALLALLGNLQAMNGGESYLHTGSRTVTAELTALQLARATAPAGLVLDPVYGPQVLAGPYFAATRALRSTAADSLPQLLQSPERERAAADSVLVRAGEVTVAGVAGPIRSSSSPPIVDRVHGGVDTTHGSCVQFIPNQAGASLELLQPATGLALRRAATTRIEIRARRFASGFPPAVLASPAGTRTVVIRTVADGSDRPWHLRISTPRALTACSLARTK